jgi:hypothetical protein
MRLTVRHLKTSNLYTVIGEASNCTNGLEHEVLILYTNDLGKVFARNRNEFWEKFEEINRCE